MTRDLETVLKEYGHEKAPGISRPTSSCPVLAAIAMAIATHFSTGETTRPLPGSTWKVIRLPGPRVVEAGDHRDPDRIQHHRETHVGGGREGTQTEEEQNRAQGSPKEPTMSGEQAKRTGSGEP